MRRAPRARQLAAALAGLVLLLAFPTAARAATVTVTNGVQFTDTSGNPLHAHGGGMIKVGSYYYWFGENRNDNNTFRYVSVYRSTDLRNWEFRNNVLTQSSAAELNVSNIERPKVIYNSSTGQYVLWMHWENGSDYGQARVAVATSSTVDGNYTYRGSFRPLGYDSRDMTVFRDDDGSAYLISSTRVNIDTATGVVSGNGSGNAYETLRPRHSGQCLDVPNQSTADGSEVAQYGCNGGANQHWQPLDLGTGYHQLIARHSNKCLTVPSSSTADGVRVTQQTCGSGTNQQWQITDVGSGYWRLTARHSGKCLDIVSGSTTAGARAIQYACSGGTNQQWQRTGAP